jgi:hypothetical protein
MCGESCSCTRPGTCAPPATTPPAPAPAGLIAKLSDFDAYADAGLAWVVGFAESHADELLTLARARHITGHWVHGEGKLFEYDRGRLAKEVAEELADAIVYAARRLAL